MTFRTAKEALVQIRERGVLRANKFLVEFSVPKIFQPTPPPEKQFSPDSVYHPLIDAYHKGELSLWAEQATLPGVALETQPVRRYGYGPVEMKPHTARFNDMVIVFRLDAGTKKLVSKPPGQPQRDNDGANDATKSYSDQLVFSFIQTWLRCINDFSYKGNLFDPTGVVPGQQPFQLSYKDEYKAPVEVVVFNDAGQEVLRIMLQDAYPVEMGDAPLQWDLKEYIRVPVKFTFFNWYSVRPEAIFGSNPPIGNTPGQPR